MKGTNMQFRNVNEALPVLGTLLLADGAEDDSRAGKTKELTFQHFTIERPLEREIMVPGRNANLAAQIAETMWVLAGRADVEWLSHYLPRAADFSDDGQVWRAGYGPRLRGWGAAQYASGKGDDQLSNVIELLQNDPTTRRAVMSIWDPSTDTAPSKDIPCNNWLHFLSRGGVLDLHVAIRSNDLVWGWSGINQFEWSVLLEVVAHYAGLAPGRIHYAVSSLHIYERHWTKAAGWKVSNPFCGNDPRFSPLFGHSWDELAEKWFELEDKIRGDVYVANQIARFPEPMLRGWLYVLAWYWTGDEQYLEVLTDSRLAAAAKLGVAPQAPVRTSTTVQAPQGSPFIQEVIALHNEKDAAYGQSWKKRGEMLGILANIARKVDRLGGADTHDETSTDTAVDLMVYLAKYHTWLDDERTGQRTSDGPAAANRLLLTRDLEDNGMFGVREEYETQLRQDLDRLEGLAMEKRVERHHLVSGMLVRAYKLARLLWDIDQSKAQHPARHLPWGQDDYKGADHE